MNVKLHTPKSLQAGSGMSSIKQFFLSLVATTVSIALTFGTAAIVDHHKKNAAKKEMVMMVISDIDETIEMIERSDTILREVSKLEQELAVHPEYFDSLSSKIVPVMQLVGNDYSETAEKIFTTSIETFNTIGDVNFVNEVSSFYITRHKYKEEILGKLKQDIEEKGIMKSLKSLLDVDMPFYSYMNWSFLQEMKDSRDRCMTMMGVSEKDMSEFTKHRASKQENPERVALGEKMMEEWLNAETLIDQAKENLKD